MDYERKEIIIINNVACYLTEYRSILKILNIKNMYDPFTNQLKIIREIEKASLISDDTFGESDDTFGDNKEDWY